MSKQLKTICRFVFGSLLISLAVSGAFAQTIQSTITINESGALIEGGFLVENKARNLSFLKSYAGIENFRTRNIDLKLFDKNRQPVSYKKLADGEYLADTDFSAWRYQIDRQDFVPKKASDAAHVSWLSGEQGILMTGDLLPEFAEKTSGKITFKLPLDGWRISSVEKRAAENVFEVADVEKAVFYIGKNLRETEISAGSAKLNLIMSGEWQIGEAEAAQTTREIFAFYENLFGGKSFEKGQIFLGKFPADVSPGNWEAETRGASVTIFSSEMNFKTQSLQRLHEQMRHELFHFWFPNGVNLSGNYDWFYEGFALYQSLKTAVAMKRIRFDDFLDTLSRVHAIDSATRRRVSLIEASKNRWNGANTQIYARGMLVAFLTDVALLQSSKGKISLESVLREIYQKHGLATPRTDGNTAILSVLESRAELRKIAESYIKAAEIIRWQTDLEAIGIESATGNFAAKLKVKANPSGRQKDLLDKLGYNNWRK